MAFTMMQFRLQRIALLALLPCVQVFAQTARLDTTTFVVMGEGLAAGMANYGLSSVVQSQSFPAQMAAQMHTAFPQPLIQPPGIGDVIGYPSQDVRYPTYPQGAVRMFYQPNPANAPAPPIFVLNLSVPSFTLADSTATRPVAPVIQTDMKQTVTNLVLGFPQLFFNPPVTVWSQFEYAKAMFPTMAMVELGYYEALSAAVDGNPAEMPDPNTFGASYQTIVKGLRDLQAQVIVTTIPNPIDTAYFNSPVAAGSILAATPSLLTSAYPITAQDYVTRNGLVTIANQFASHSVSPLPAGSVLPAATAAQITANVNALNAQIVNVAKSTGAVVYDLNAFLHGVKTSGATISVAGTTGTTSQTLDGNYLGGFYSLDGVYPGPTGHALIANDILAFLNKTYSKSFSPVNVSTVAAADTTIQVQRPTGDLYTSTSLGLTGQDRRMR
jgi:hypothetical protein